MTPHVIALPGNEALAARLAEHIGAELGAMRTRHFPDGETYVRIESSVRARNVIMVATLDRPNDKILPLLFAAEDARDLGAGRVGLVAPYLAYMRQDQRFRPGEAITSKTFAHILSGAFDYLVTVDPHLHRRSAMGEIYSIAVGVAHAAASVSAWVKHNVSNAVVIGPDAESEQWVAAVALAADSPFAVLEKQRRGDRDVEITVRDLEQFRGRQPVLIDDIISSGRTMETAIRELMTRGFAPPAVVGVHGVFAEDAYQRLLDAGANQIVSTNTVPHVSNAIDVMEIIAEALRNVMI